ncbi:MAG: DUF2190 family protein, partial [Clostridiales bacterium]|nr:DUF2190 family protein [Clostridiales bacterium]
MSAATYWQRGESIDYPNETEEIIEAGTILKLGDIVGIAGEEIAAGETGSAHIEGVFKVAKAAEAFTIGQDVYLVSDEASGTEGEGDDDVRLGRAVAAAAADDAEVLVKI